MRIGETSSNDFEFVIHKKLFSHDENSIGKRPDLNSVELYTVLILAAFLVSVLVYHILVLVGWYFGRYFQVCSPCSLSILLYHVCLLYRIIHTYLLGEKGVPANF